MRTTVTIEADTEHLLRKEAARTGRSFKAVLNDAIRQALTTPPKERVQVTPVFPAAFPADLTRGSFNRLGEEWDDDEALGELGR
ncbi:MAG: hypothetical protein ACFE0O_01800 [Opitutales bacterium]